MPQPSEMQAAATEQHQWLQQLVGTWKVSAEMPGAPGSEPMRMESTETVRRLGELWVLKESDAVVGGFPFRAVMTIGYEPRKQAFSGTWVDSAQPVLWVYEGELDEDERVLILDTMGPDFTEQGIGSKLVPYQDRMEFIDDDHRLLTSHRKGNDGKWQPFIEIHYHRKSNGGKASRR
jgi:hypothetical protein